MFMDLSLGKKNPKKTPALLVTLSSLCLLLKLKSHTKRKWRVNWWGQDYFSSSLCDHFEALSQSGETLTEYSASQQPSQKQQRLKLPGSSLAASPSKLFVRESVMRNISTKRDLTCFVYWCQLINPYATACGAGCWIYSVLHKVKNIRIKLCSLGLGCITSGLA